MAHSMNRLGSRHLAIILIIAGVLMIAGALAMIVENIHADNESGERQAAICQSLNETFAQGTHAAPEGDMPIAKVDGVSYLGMLEIPSLGLSLPVQATWDAGNARISPVRWSGSAYDDDLVIAGQAYQSQFGNIGQLQKGDQLVLTDIYGNRLEYQVVGKYNIDKGATFDASDEDTDLLLCTYTTDGLSGICVSCARTMYGSEE